MSEISQEVEIPEPDDVPLSGEIKSYNDDNGQLVSISNFKDGRLNGIFSAYDEHGLLVMESHFKAGILHGMMTIYDAGKMQAKFMYADGIRDGESRHYNLKTGLLMGIEQYKADKLHGKSVWYTEEGGLLSEAMYQNGKLHGQKTDYYKSGQVLQRTYYEADLAEGPAIGYFENGMIREKKFFKAGRQVGNTEEYLQNWKKKKPEEFFRLNI